MIKTTTLFRFSEGSWWRRNAGQSASLMVCRDWGERLGLPDRAKVEISDVRRTGFTLVKRLGKSDEGFSPVTFGRHKITDSYTLGWDDCLREVGFGADLKEFWVRISPA